MAKYYDIDPYNCSIDDLKSAISKLDTIASKFDQNQHAVKIFLNSIYGVTGASFYSLYNVNIAESITLQGQHLIKYATSCINYLFKNEWPKMRDSHLKIANIMKIKHPDFDVENFLVLASNKVDFETLQVMGDTDSSYLSFYPIILMCGIKHTESTDFILAIQEVFLADYLNRCFEKYAETFNCPCNLEEFELEKIARTIILTSKKHYVMDVSWKEPNVYVEPLHSLNYKGLEVVMGSTPPFSRQCMKDFIEYILSNEANNIKTNYADLVNKVRKYKKNFVLQNPDNICKLMSMSSYDKFVLEDKKRLVYTDSVPVHVRAASVYNHMLYSSAKKYKSKYNTIKQGDKVRFYYAGGNDPDAVFAYLNGSYPAEFALPINVDKTFEKNLLDPINRIVVACGFQPIVGALTYSKSLF